MHTTKLLMLALASLVVAGPNFRIRNAGPGELDSRTDDRYPGVRVLAFLPQVLIHHMAS